ncbi:MAG: endonuclease III [Peptococcaceae bacterium]|nr:MAG: endonuclease III [Peptococcaceae bacterium]
MVLELLAGAYPESATGLKYRTPFELLVAAILSAQCTDKQVNKITGRLFEKYRTPQDFALLSVDELAGEIKGCGLYRNKSRHIVRTARTLLERYDGRLPESRPELESLPGVGRKTAGVVLGEAFGRDTMPVDTHVFRVARRIGLAAGKTPRQVEQELLACIPAGQRMAAHHRLISHGRRVCTARRPKCPECCLRELCLFPS